MFLSLIPETENIAAYNIILDNRQIFASEIVNEFGYHRQEAQGFPLIAEHRWMDIYVYLDGDGQAIRYFVSDAESEELLAYGGIRVYDDWIGREYGIELNVPFEYWENELGVGAPITEIEFVRVGDGSVMDYFKDNMTAYNLNRQQIEEFLDNEIELIPIEHFIEHGN
jgi:hypothetical protein